MRAEPNTPSRRQLLDRDGPLLVVIGPSAAGKSSVVRQLVLDGVVHITPTWTTREPRDDERQGSIDHVFVGDGTFDERDAGEGFLEVVQLFGLPHRYGLPRVESVPGRVPLIMLRSSLLDRVQPHYTNIVVYQIEDAPERVTLRMADRVRVGEQIGTRLAQFQEEVALGRALADRVFVNRAKVADLALEVERALRLDFEQR